MISAFCKSGSASPELLKKLQTIFEHHDTSRHFGVNALEMVFLSRGLIHVFIDLQKILKHNKITMHVPENVKCPRCNEVMSSLQACHLICKNCGAHLDCSDKGSYW